MPKNSPKVRDAEITRAFEHTYKDINELIMSVNGLSSKSNREGYKGKNGDMRLYRDLRTKQYFFEGRFDDGWAQVELDLAKKTNTTTVATSGDTNVQSDWNVSDNTSDAFIKNKPTVQYTSAIPSMGSGNSYAAGLTPAGSGTHSDTYLRKDGTWATPINTTYSVMASGNSYAAGLVPAGSGTHNNTFLRKDGTWVAPSSGIALTDLSASAPITYDNSSGAFSIADHAVTLAKLPEIASARFLGRTSSSTGDVEVLTVGQVGTLLSLDQYLTAPRTVTAGGNTLDSSETLAFVAGSNVTITESGGSVTIASTDTNTDTVDMGDGFRFVYVDGNVQVTENKYLKLKTVDGSRGFGSLLSGDGSSSSPWIITLPTPDTDTNTTDLNSLSAGVINTSNDSFGFIDADDSNASKKESIADFLTAIAGSGISAGSGQLSRDSIALGGLSNVSSSSPSSGDFLKWGGSQWEPTAVSVMTGWKLRDSSSASNDKTVSEGKFVKIVAANSGSYGDVAFSGSTGATDDPFVVSISAPNTDRYVNDASFNTSTGVLTLTRAGSDSATVTEDLDGRYLTGITGQSISNLNDVNSISGISNGQVLVWNSTANAFQPGSSSYSWYLRDGDTTAVEITSGKYVKLVEGTGIDINFTDTDSGASDDEFDVTITNTLMSSGGTISGDLVISDYESKLTLTKTRNTTQSFHIAHENDDGVLDFLRESTRTARITNNGRWVIGGYTEVNSSTLSVNGTFGVDSTSQFGGVITSTISSGTIMSRGGFSDFIGYNSNYGTYIGGGASNASRYIYAGGYFYDGSSVRTLLHSGNVGYWVNDNRNFWFTTPTNTNGQGFGLQRNDGTFQLQLYGDGSAQGFLTGQWASWDLRKYINGQLSLRVGGSDYTVWHEGNDGSGSGLDADTVDGYHGSNYIGKNGNTYYRPNTWINMVDGGNAGLYWSSGTGAGWHLYPKDTGAFYIRSGNSNYCQVELSANGTVRGMVYADSSNNVGLLNQAGGWALQKVSAGAMILHDAGGNTKLGSGDEWGRLEFENYTNGTYVYLNQATFRVDADWNPYGNSVRDLGSNTLRWDNLWVNTIAQVGQLKLNNSFVWSQGGSDYGRFTSWLEGSGTHGMYFPNTSMTTSPHFYPVGTGSSYGTYYCSNGQSTWHGIIMSGHSDKPTYMHDSSHGGGGLYYQTSGVWAMYWAVGNACLGVGSSTTSSSYHLYAHGAIYSTGDIVAFSDARVKTNVLTIDNALDKVLNMRGVYYNPIDKETKEVDDRRRVGVIAQELNEVLPEAVTYAEDVDEYGVDYGKLTGVLIEAIKELKQEINELKGS